MNLSKLDLDFNLNTAGKLKLHEGVDGLLAGAVDVNEALVAAQFELLTALLVNECRAVYCEDSLACGQGNWTTDYSSCFLYCLYNPFSGLVDQIVVVRLQFDSNLWTHLCNLRFNDFLFTI